MKTQLNTSGKTCKILALFLSFLLIFEQSGFAQVAAQLGIPGQIAALQGYIVPDAFRPLHLRSLSYDTLNNNFKLLLDKGSLKNPKAEEVKDTTKQLLNYFSVGLTLPNDAFWVNLRPDGESNIIDSDLAKTDVGRVLLEADLQLKKDTARFTSPETPEGRKYWDKLYKKAEKLFGTQNITIPTLTRVWILPHEIIISENKTSAHIYKATLRVLLEKDYLKDSSLYEFNDPKQKELNEYSSQLFRELIIPKLTKEVNASKRYANLRQAYYSLIMAQWFKARFAGKKGLTPQGTLPDLIDTRDLSGLTSKEPWSTTTYFKAYQKSVNEGEYNIQQNQDAPFTSYHQTTKSYFSGGVIANCDIPALGGATFTNFDPATNTGTSVTSIPAAANPAVNPNRAVGVEVDTLGEVNITQAPPALQEPEVNPGQAVKGSEGPKEIILGSGPAAWFVRKFGNVDVGKAIANRFRKEGAPQVLVSVAPSLEPEFNIKESPEAVEYSYGDFRGVDLEHFVHAQTRLSKLADGEFPVKDLIRILTALGLDQNLTGNLAYRKIYEELAKGRYNRDIINDINGFDRNTGTSTYTNPRLGVTIVDQNANPRAQSIYEAVANGLDALGFKIGQFGKGVKQIIDWLEEANIDRIDVYTRKENANAYQLTILKGKSGQEYIQIREIPVQRFQEIAQGAGGKDIDKGTILQAATQKAVPLTDGQRDTTQHNSLQEIADGIHKRFPYVTSVEIETQLENEGPQKVNGFKEKAVIVPADAAPYNHEEAKGKSVYVRLNSHSITVLDNGIGMSGDALSRMFVPKSGTKKPEFLSGEKAERELGEVKVVHDTSLPHRLSFARNGEVVFAVDIPENIHADASVLGGLMVEFGLLLDVPESRDNIILPQARPGEETGFQKAIMFAVNRIGAHPRLSAKDKARYINTIVIGLDGLIQGNENNSNVIKNLRALIQERLVPVIEELKKEGFVILPHDRQFGKLELPQDKKDKAIFIHEGLFSWQGAVSLKEIGADVIPLIKVGGEKRLPLLVARFSPEYLIGITKFDRLWHTWRQSDRIAMIKTERFVAIPQELGSRLKELAAKKAAKGLDKKEEKEFAKLVQLVKIITAEEVVTSYEVAPPKEALTIEEVKFEESRGQVDSEAINEFLATPPVAAKSSRASAEEARINLFGEAVYATRTMDDLNLRKGETLIRFAEASVKAGRLNDAEALFKDALRFSGYMNEINIIRQTDPLEKPAILEREAERLLLLAQAEAGLGDKVKADELLVSAHQFVQVANMPDHLKSLFLTRLAQALFANGNKVKAEELLNEAGVMMSVKQSRLGDLAVFLNALAEAGRGEETTTRFLFNKAWDVVKEVNLEAQLKSEITASPAAYPCVKIVQAMAKSAIWENTSVWNILGLIEKDMGSNYYLPLAKLYAFRFIAKGQTTEDLQAVRLENIINDIIPAIEKIRGPLEPLVLAEGANMLLELGYKEKAEEWFKRALELLPQADNEIKAKVLIKFAESSLAEEAAQAEASVADRLKKANELADRIYGTTDRAPANLALAAMAYFAAGRGDEANRLFAEAKDAARKTADEFERVLELSTIARALDKTGRKDEADELFNEAKDCARNVTDLEHKGIAISAITQSFDRSSRMIEAAKNNLDFGGVTGEPLAISALNAIEALEKLDIAGAIKIAEEITGTDDLSRRYRNWVLRNIVQVLAEKDRVNEAIDVTEKITDDTLYKVYAHCAMFEASAKRGLRDELYFLSKAKDTAAKITDDLDKALALLAIAGTLARIGETAEAIKAAEEITNESLKAEAFADIALALGDMGAALAAKPAQTEAKVPALFSDTRPQDAPHQYEIIPGEGNSSYLRDSGSGRELAFYTRVERVAADKGIEVFLGYWEDNTGQIDIFIARADSVREVLFSTGVKDGVSWAVAAKKGNLIVIEKEEGDIKQQFLFDTDISTGSLGDQPYMFSPARRISLSASGRFAVREGKDGKLYYYDHKERMQIGVGLSEPAYKNYRVDDKADVVITQDKNGKYSLFSLEQIKFLIDKVDHIEVDSSGQVAIFKRGNKIGYLWLNKEGEMAVDVGVGDKIRVGSNGDRYTYLMVENEANSTYYGFTFDKTDSSITSWVNGAFIPNRFWEEYDLEKKTIWDKTANRSYTLAGVGPVAVRYNASKIEPNKLALYGDAAVIGHEDSQRSNFISLSAEKDSSRLSLSKLAALEGKRVWYDGEQAIIMGEGGIITSFQKSKDSTILSNWKFLLIDILADIDPGLRLINHYGSVFNIKSQVPPGFTCIGVNGEYFVFVNPNTREVRYLDPEKAFTQAPAQKAQPTLEEIQREQEEIRKTMESWKENVLSHRNAFIAQVQESYQPFLKLVPEEFRGEVERIVKSKIERLFAEQDNELRKRFQDAQANAEPINLGHLSFDHFAGQMSRITPLLEEYTKSLNRGLSQEPYQTQKGVWLSIFSKLFELAANTTLNIDSIDNNLLEVLTFGWDIGTQEQINAAGLINNLIASFKENAPNIDIAQARKIVEFLSNFAGKNPVLNVSVLQEQLGKILSLKPDVRRAYLEKLVDAFKGANNRALNEYLQHPVSSSNLGKAREFAVFLTNKVGQLAEREKFIPQGRERMPEGHDGVSITQIMQLEEQRKKTAAAEEKVMSVPTLISAVENNNLPMPDEDGELKIVLVDAKVQAEPGAHTREIAQNSLDATGARQKELEAKKDERPSGQEYKGELTVSFYLQREPDGMPKYYIEEATDNGTGALYEVALLIPMSTKAIGEQKDLAGFFGTGKYTIFEGADSVEIITKNSERAHMFTFSITRDSSGNAVKIKLTGIREVNDANVGQGVTVRRIKSISNTIPELDAMLAERSWKTFAGLAQSENFKIYFIDREGKRQPLEVKHEALAEADFKALERGKKDETNFGKMGIISTEDMPLQIVDKRGLRVCELKEEYLALIPAPLRKHIQELGIIIQIPLPLIRNRTAFEHENEYLSVIQKYVAVQFYKAIAYKALTEVSPQFVFEGFSLDWETNDAYWNSINLGDKEIASLAAKINAGDYSAITKNELKGLLTERDKLDKAKKFVKLILLLEANTGKDKQESLLLRRLAIQQEIDRERAEAQAKLLRDSGMPVKSEDIPQIRDIPQAQDKLTQAKGIETGHEQMRHIKDFLVNPKDYSAQEKELVELARPIAREFGLENVILVESRVSFAGGFLIVDGKKTMAINRSIADDIGRAMGAHIDEATDTLVHELGHLLEQLMREDDLNGALKNGYVAHTSDFSHDAVGTFAEAMKYVAAVAVANHNAENGNGSNLSQGPGTPAVGQALGMEGEVEAYLIGLRSLDSEVAQNAQERLAELAQSDPEAGNLLTQALEGEAYSAVRARIEEIIKELKASNAGVGVNTKAQEQSNNPSRFPKPGGIDFRNLPIVVQSVGNLSSSVRNSPVDINRLSSINLDSEWRKIEDLVNQGIIPEAEKLKQYLQASCVKGSMDKDTDRVISCISDILRLEEELYVETEPALKDILVVLESATSLQELKAAFIGNS